MVILTLGSCVKTYQKEYFADNLVNSSIRLGDDHMQNKVRNSEITTEILLIFQLKRLTYMLVSNIKNMYVIYVAFDAFYKT